MTLNARWIWADEEYANAYCHFRRVFEVGEVAMVLPFAGHVREALAEHHGPWYFMVESLVGV